MIGRHLVKALIDSGYDVVGLDYNGDAFNYENLKHYKVDLIDKIKLELVFKENKIDRVIHLAALAHAADGKKFTWDDYYRLNVECSKNIFMIAKNIPILFVSTVDVYGFTDSVVDIDTELKPVTSYGKTKAIAEAECRKLPSYTIFRFSPVYSDKIKRDIQKRYYLKYPNIAYQIGKGSEYEVLNINKAVSAMVSWCSEEVHNNIRIIKDSKNLNTRQYIKSEKAEGRAKIVLYFPQWIINAGYFALKAISGENKYTYLLNKAVHPIKSK